jgi:hypothetical protein
MPVQGVLLLKFCQNGGKKCQIQPPLPSSTTPKVATKDNNTAALNQNPTDGITLYHH